MIEGFWVKMKKEEATDLEKVKTKLYAAREQYGRYPPHPFSWDGMELMETFCVFVSGSVPSPLLVGIVPCCYTYFCFMLLLAASHVVVVVQVNLNTKHEVTHDDG